MKVIAAPWLIPASSIVRTRGLPTAREILQAQYARGEIAREEYEQIRRDLDG